MVRTYILLSGFSLLVSSQVSAQTTPDAEALSLITKTAGEICTTVDQKGSKTSAQLNGEVTASLNNLWARVANIGIKLGGNLGSQHYEGLPQEALKTAIENHDRCSLAVLYFLGDKTGFVRSVATTTAGWADLGVIGDWGARDYAYTTTATPKYSVKDTKSAKETTLCDDKHLGYVAVCWEGRPTGYPAGTLTDIPAGEKPGEWCTYKSSLITLTTAHSGASPGRLYVCARTVPP